MSPPASGSGHRWDPHSKGTPRARSSLGSRSRRNSTVLKGFLRPSIVPDTAKMVRSPLEIALPKTV